MIKSYILIPLLLLFISASSFGQKIHFTDSINNWKIEKAEWTPLTYLYTKSSSDSIAIINGIKYTYVKHIGLCREDTLQNKVFILHPKDTVEKILFDYNLKKGDTFYYQFYGCEGRNEKGLVVKADSTIIAGSYHKAWQFENLDFPYRNTIIIEGVGIMRWEGWDINKNTVCFSRNGAIVTIIDYVHINPATCALAVSNINTNNNTITIAPNPANQYTKITFPYTIQLGSLTITDILGKAVSTKTINNKTETTIGTMPASGLYFYNLRDFTSNQSYTGKFIYE